MKNRIIALFLTIILIFSCTIITNAKSQQDFNKVTLSMYCNVSEKRSITGVYSENNFYVKVDDLCDVTNGKIIEQTEEYVVLSYNYEIRKIKIYHSAQNMTEDIQEIHLIAMPVIEYDNSKYYSLLHFLRYLDISVSIEEKAETQIKIFVRYNIFDALGEYIENNKGNFFWWDEVKCTENENLEGKLVNSGIVALINRDSNFFRMMFDAEGIEREALEDALISLLTNEGEPYFNESNSSLELLNIAKDTLGFTADVVDFVVDAYETDANKSLGNFISNFSTVSTISANSIVNFVNAFATMKQFDAITETQRTLLEETILEYPENSALLCGEWARLQEAARNVNVRVKDAFANGFESGNKAVTGTAYDLLQGSVSGGDPVAFAWSGTVFINKLIPYTSNMIDKKTQLYNAYLCSIIQMVANELLSDAVSDLNNAGFMQFDSTSQFEHLVESKNSLILQLKATLTTREYLIKSGFLEKSYAEEMQAINKQTAGLLNKIENCKIVLVGMDPSVPEDLTWMEKVVVEQNIIELNYNKTFEVNGVLSTRDYEINSNNKGTVYILTFDNPKSFSYNVDSNSETTFYTLNEMQCNFSSSKQANKYIGKEITVSGNPMEGHTGHHRTAIVLLDSVIVDEKGDNSKNISIIDFLGMTINEIGEMYGTEYHIADWLEAGNPTKLIVYEDKRLLSYHFYTDVGEYNTPAVPEKDTISSVEYYNDTENNTDSYYINDELKTNITFAELSSKYKGAKWTDIFYKYTIMIGNISIDFCYYDLPTNNSVADMICVSVCDWIPDDSGWEDGI